MDNSTLEENAIITAYVKEFNEFKLPGSSSILKNLLENGAYLSNKREVDVFGYGHFSSFVKSNVVEGVWELVFDREHFLKSKIFKEYLESALERMKKDLLEMQYTIEIVIRIMER